jgi:hypothetical protein
MRCQWHKLIFGLVALIATGCGPVSETGGNTRPLYLSSGGGGSEAGLQAFKSGLYSFVNTQGCVKCHASIVTPRFAATDVSVAYAEARGAQRGSSAPLVDFSNPANSIFIVYSGNNHCGDVACSNPAIRTNVQSALLAWANAELSGSPGDTDDTHTRAKFMTSSLAIPTDLPDLTVATPGVLRFPLAVFGTKIPALKNALLEVELQLVNPTTYRVSKPKIVGNTAAVKVTGLHVYVRAAAGSGTGVEDTRQGDLWVSVSAIADIFAMPKQPPKGPNTAVPLSTLALAIPVPDPASVMTIGFDSLE